MHKNDNSRVKNKQAAPQQITAEQIMREASERQESEYKKPKQIITDTEELEHFRVTKRKEFEDTIRRNNHNVGNWIKYAKFEEEQKQFKRARSVYERALNVDHKNILVWLKYVDMEMKNENINRARNIWERAVSLLPRVDQFWLKYILMENMIGNFIGVRQIYERWMEWKPAVQAWNTYINFEIKHGEVENARQIFQRYVRIHPLIKSWIKFAKFEHKHGSIEAARFVYQSALEYYGEENYINLEELFIKFAEFEVMNEEFERARTIYKYAMDHIPKSKADHLYKMFISFEKRFGNQEQIEDVIFNKQRFHYENEIEINPKNYDIWFDYIRLEENNLKNGQSAEKLIELFERAIGNVPPMTEKRFWKRYIYLWINYAIFQESNNKINETREIYKKLIDLIPHKTFSFSKIWIMYSHFEIRQNNLQNARSILGQAIGKAAKSKIFIEYIDVESKLGNIDRVRLLYEKWLELFPFDCNGWCKYAEMEYYLEEIERTRAIYDAAIQQPLLDLPELVWKHFIDFELNEKQYDNVRNLYNRLLERSQHVKVWVSFALFEYSLENVVTCRTIFERAFNSLRNAQPSAMNAANVKVGDNQPIAPTKEDRVLLFESWKDWEIKNGDQQFIQKVQSLQPKRVVKTRQVKSADGEDVGTEEYYDFIFPDEVNSEPLKLIELAQMWKKRKIAGAE